MATYVNDLRLKEIATGDESGTWGTSTNTNLELIGEALGYGTQDCFASDANATTTVADGAADPARAMYFKVTSSATLSTTRTLTIAPNTVSRVMFIENATTGSQSIAISQGSGANVTILTGKTTVVYLDGAGSGAVVVDAMALVDPGVTDTLTEVLAAGNATGSTDIDVDAAQKVQFRDAAIYINSSVDGQLDIVADTEIQIAATTVDLNGNLDVSGTALVTGVLTTTATQVATGGITSGSNIVSDTDSTDDLGTTSVRWANLFVDGITATDQITATGFTGTLDGILGSGAAAAATLTTLNTSGAVNLNLTTDSTSSTSGALIIDGGVGVAKKLFVGTDLDVDGAATFNAGVIINESGIDADFRVETNGQGNIIFADGANDTLHVQCSATPSATVSGFMFASDQFFTSAGATASSNTQVRFYNANGLVGSITVADSATAFNTSSDYRLKENVSYAWDATTRLKQLKPARFNFISDSSNTLLDGFLAHEVSDTVPNAVSGTKDAEIQENGDGYQSIDHSKLVPLLVKTIQELEARITTLEGA